MFQLEAEGRGSAGGQQVQQQHEAGWRNGLRVGVHETDEGAVLPVPRQSKEQW